MVRTVLITHTHFSSYFDNYSDDTFSLPFGLALLLPILLISLLFRLLFCFVLLLFYHRCRPNLRRGYQAAWLSIPTPSHMQGLSCIAATVAKGSQREDAISLTDRLASEKDTILLPNHFDGFVWYLFWFNTRRTLLTMMHPPPFPPNQLTTMLAYVAEPRSQSEWASSLRESRPPLRPLIYPPQAFDQNCPRQGGRQELKSSRSARGHGVVDRRGWDVRLLYATMADDEDDTW